MENLKVVAMFDLLSSAKRRHTSNSTWTLFLLCQLDTPENGSEPRSKASYVKLYDFITERATWNDSNFVALIKCLGKLTATDFEAYHLSAHIMFMGQPLTLLQCVQEDSSSRFAPFPRAKTSAY
ncbi:hypothetical protein PR048_026998, partial [Dryococelus australis]